MTYLIFVAAVVKSFFIMHCGLQKLDMRTKIMQKLKIRELSFLLISKVMEVIYF